MENNLERMQELKAKWAQLTQRFHSLAEESLNQNYAAKRLGTIGIFITAFTFLCTIASIIIDLDVTFTTVTATASIIPWILTLYLFNSADMFQALAVYCAKSAVDCKIRELQTESKIITFRTLQELEKYESKT